MEPIASENGLRASRTSRSLRPKKTATLLAERIVTEIAEQKLPPGAPLPSERAMLEEYAVARGTLREALRFLEIQGVISIKTGTRGGPVVAEPSSRPVASTIGMLLQLSGTPFRDVVETRLVLETNLASKAAQRATDEQIQALHDSVERMRARLEDNEAFLNENEHFHTLVAEAAGNHVFALVSSSLTWIWDGTLLGVDYPEDVRQSVVAEHARIYRAISERNSERAAAAMSVHLTDYVAYLERYYPQVLDAPLKWEQIS